MPNSSHRKQECYLKLQNVQGGACTAAGRVLSFFSEAAGGSTCTEKDFLVALREPHMGGSTHFAWVCVSLWHPTLQFVSMSRPQHMLGLELSDRVHA